MGIFAGHQTRFGETASSAYFERPPASHPVSMLPRLRLCSYRFFFRYSGMRALSAVTAVLALGACPGLWAQQREAAGQLIRETVYNELQDHNSHGYWRYWIEQRVENDTRLKIQVETADGPIARLVETDGHPLDAQKRDEEDARLARLLNSPLQRAVHRKGYKDVEDHAARIMKILPEAYVFEFVGEENGCHHLRFSPSPAYVPHTVEEKVVHAMAGDVWIDARMKRLSRLEGHLDENVDFGFGLLGHLDKGGWIRVERVQVSPTQWKTQRLEWHMSGRAVLFKTIARDTNEVRGGFAAVPAGLDLAQGMRILEQADPRSAPSTMARLSPVSLSTQR
jgi:hypothetical protein